MPLQAPAGAFCQHMAIQSDFKISHIELVSPMERLRESEPRYKCLRRRRESGART